jgi:flagellar hook-length control protein FliK
MSIESSPSSTAGLAPPRAAGAAGRGAHGAAQSGAATGLFSCVLTGLTETPLPVLAAASGSSDQLALPGAGLAADPATLPDASTQSLLAQFLGLGISPAPLAPAGNDAAAALPATALPLTGSVLAKQISGSSTVPLALATLPGSTPMGAVNALPERVDPESLQAFKFPLAGLDDSVGSGEAATAGPLPMHSLTAADAAARAVALADAGAAAPGAPPRAGQSAVRQALANAQGLVKWQQTQSEPTLASATLSGASARDVFADQALQPWARAADSAALPGVVTAVGGSDAQGLRQRERGSAGPGASRFEPMNFSAVLPAFDVNPAAAPASTAAPLAASLAEQVKYWMTNDIRNAELQLDGLGAEPVQVSITMSGNEAQVVFRSDQAQTRELLGNAMGQLEQLLRGEGLALAGAWVGASGQQAGSGGGTQQGQAGSAAPQQTLARDGVSNAGAAPTGRRVVPTERVLDLFA